MEYHSNNAADTELIHKLRRENFEKFRDLINMHLTFTDVELNAEQLEALWRDDSTTGKSFEKNMMAAKPTANSAVVNFSLDIRPVSSSFEGSGSRHQSGGVSRFRAKLARDRRSVGGLLYSSSSDADAVSQMTNYLRAATNAIALLEKENCERTTGIFRKSGSQVRQSVLRTRLLKNEITNLDEAFVDDASSSIVITVHDLASVLKNLIRDFPTPLITETHASLCADIGERTKNGEETLSKVQFQSLVTRQLRVVQLMMLTLSITHAEFLHRLLRLLKNVSVHKETNKMDEYNLAVVFTPVIFAGRSSVGVGGDDPRSQTQPLVKLLALVIERLDQVFQIPREVLQDIDLYYRTEHCRENNRHRLYDAGSLNKRFLLVPSNSDYSAADQQENAPPIRTTITFVDRERSAADSGIINTETSLAALYAHVQMMPDGPEKRKRLSQFKEYNRDIMTSNRSGIVATNVAKAAGVRRQLLTNLRRNVMNRGEKVYCQMKKRRRSLSFMMTGGLSEHELSSTNNTTAGGGSNAALDYWDSARYSSNTSSSCSYDNFSTEPFSSVEYDPASDPLDTLPSPSLDLSEMDTS